MIKLFQAWILFMPLWNWKMPMLFGIKIQNLQNRLQKQNITQTSTEVIYSVIMTNIFNALLMTKITKYSKQNNAITHHSQAGFGEYFQGRKRFSLFVNLKCCVSAVCLVKSDTCQWEGWSYSIFSNNAPISLNLYVLYVRAHFRLSGYQTPSIKGGVCVITVCIRH